MLINCQRRGLPWTDLLGRLLSEEEWWHRVGEWGERGPLAKTICLQPCLFLVGEKPGLPAVHRWHCEAGQRQGHHSLALHHRGPLLLCIYFLLYRMDLQSFQRGS